MFLKHLQNGDSEPEFTGKLRLYSMVFCPFAQQVILTLQAKKIDYEIVYIYLDNKPEWFTTEKSPKGWVPALEVKHNEVLTDSAIISEYLEEAYPEFPVYRKDPLSKAQDKLFLDAFTPVQTAFFAAAYRKDSSEDNLEGFFQGLNQLEYQLNKRRTTFLAGENPGWVDFMVWPWLERVEVLPSLGMSQFEISPEKYSAVDSYIAAMKSSKSIHTFRLSAENHLKYFEARQQKKDVYDMLNEIIRNLN